MTELTALEKIEKLGKSVAKMTQADLARAVGCSRERIRQLVPRLKVKPGKRAGAWHHMLAKREREAMARLYESGTSLADIGRRHGVSDYHVREAIREVRKSLTSSKKSSRKR